MTDWFGGAGCIAQRHDLFFSGAVNGFSGAGCTTQRHDFFSVARSIGSVPIFSGVVNWRSGIPLFQWRAQLAQWRGVHCRAH